MLGNMFFETEIMERQNLTFLESLTSNNIKIFPCFWDYLSSDSNARTLFSAMGFIFA